MKVLRTSALVTRAKRIYPGTSSLYLIPGLIPEKRKAVTIAILVSMARTVTTAMYDGFNSHGGWNDQNNHESHNGYDGFNSYNSYDD